MLSDHHCQLLTAYLDGDLGARQRKAVLRLLRKSPEARELLSQMQRDAERLRSLPQRRAAQDFPLQVLRTIAERGIRPTPSARPPVPVRSVPKWVPLAAAASVLLMVTVASYLYFSHLGTEPDQHPVVASQDLVTPPVRQEQPPSPPVPPPSRPVETGLKLALRQLGDAPARTRLNEALQKESAYHLNLGIRDTARAVDHLKAVLKTRGIEVMVDRRVQANLKKKQKTSYWLFAENIKPAELAQILQELGTDFKNAAKNAAPQLTFDTVVLNSLTTAHRQQMARLLGVPADKLQPAPRRLPGSALSPDMFRDNIIAVSAGDHPATAKTRPVPAPPDRFALVVASHLDGAGHPAMSPEIRRFLQRRQEQRPQPGTLQVILELQEVSV